MKSIKEKLLLVKWSQAMGKPVPPELLEEVKNYEELQKEIKASVRQNLLEDLNKAKEVSIEPVIIKEDIEYPKPPSVNEALKLINNSIKQLEENKKNSSLIERASEQITKEVKEEKSFQQPDPSLVDKNLEAIQKKLKFLEQAIGKIAATGPGGGASDSITLDNPCTVVTGDYTVTRRDYYVGVNCTTRANITLSQEYEGRTFIIKDESGHAQHTPIKIIGTIDNDPNGAFIKINNGALQLIYRGGSWRII